LEPSRLAIVIQNGNPAKFTSCRTILIGLPNLDTVPFPIKHHHTILIFEMCIGVDGIAIAILCGGESPEDATGVHIGDIQPASMRGGDEETSFEIGSKAPHRIIANL
jgi:hypothetical protein